MLRLPKIFAFHHFNFTLKTVLFFYLKMCQSEKSDFFFFNKMGENNVYFLFQTQANV